MTEQCPKLNMAAYNLEIVRKQMRKCSKMVIISSVLAAIFLTIIGYSIFKIVEAVRFYFQRRQQFDEMKNKAMNKNATYDSRNDNEALRVYNTDDVTKQQTEYKTYTSSITNSVRAYKEYNDKLTEYYKTTYSEDAPDQIDKSILLAANDNYVVKSPAA